MNLKEKNLTTVLNDLLLISQPQNLRVPLGLSDDPTHFPTPFTPPLLWITIQIILCSMEPQHLLRDVLPQLFLISLSK